jgi:hypothetical protein
MTSAGLRGNQAGGQAERGRDGGRKQFLTAGMIDILGGRTSPSLVAMVLQVT